MANYTQFKLLLFLPLLPLLGSTLNFEDDIQPLLEDYCIDCHGPDKQKSGFRVDRRVHLLKGGIQAFLRLFQTILQEVIS